MSGKRRDPSIVAFLTGGGGPEGISESLLSVLDSRYRNLRIVVLARSGEEEEVARRSPAFGNAVSVFRWKGRTHSAAIWRHLRRSGADYVALLSGGTRVAAGWFSSMVAAAAERGDCGAFASRVLVADYPWLLWSAGLSISFMGYAWPRGCGCMDGARWDGASETAAADFSAAFLRASALRRAGRIAPCRSPVYSAADLGLRLWKAGYRVLYVPEARASRRGCGREREEAGWWVDNLRDRARILRSFPLRRSVWAPLLRQDLRWFKEHLKGCRYEAFAAALRAVALLAAYLPGALLDRLLRRFRRRSPVDFGPLIDRRRNHKFPLLPLSPRDWDGGKTPSRMLVTASSEIRGKGWYPVQKGKVYFRWIGQEAALSLRAPSSDCVLQIQAGNPHAALDPITLTIFADGEELGRFVPRKQFSTWRSAVRSRGERVSVQLKASGLYDGEVFYEPADASVRIAEVSLFEKGSVFLRDPLPPLPPASYVQMSDEDDGLERGWYGYDPGYDMRWIRGEARLRLSVPDGREGIAVHVTAKRMLDDFPQRLEVFVDGERIGLRLVPPAWESLRFRSSLPPGEHDVVLRVDRGVPPERCPGDPRELALMVRRVELDLSTPASEGRS